MQEISEQVARFSSKNVADYNSIELVSWYMALTVYNMSAEGAAVRKSVIKALKKATKELKRRDLM